MKYAHESYYRRRRCKRHEERASGAGSVERPKCEEEMCLVPRVGYMR